MRVFVTGHRGYIGVHLVELLKAAGHEVTGCDLKLFDGCEWSDCTLPDRELVKDVRALNEKDLDGHDCVMHLAAISNDPMGDLDPDLTYSVNLEGSVRLAEIAKAAGVGRYLFSGSCSVYGKGEKLDLTEEDTLHPLTAYAKSKVETERRVSDLADEGFTPAYLRNSTAFGHSPMLRIDLVVNNLLGSALAYDEIRIKSDGTPWRPLFHCRDIAHAFVAFLTAPAEAIRDKAVNIGANEQNYQVRDVGAQVERLLPSAKVVFTGEVGEDPRDYRVKFDRLTALFPDFKPEFDLESGMEELCRQMKDKGFGAAEFEGPKYTRLRTLQGRLDRLGAAPA